MDGDSPNKIFPAAIVSTYHAVNSVRGRLMAVIESEKGWGRRGGGMLDTTLNKLARQNAGDGS